MYVCVCVCALNFNVMNFTFLRSSFLPLFTFSHFNPSFNHYLKIKSQSINITNHMQQFFLSSCIQWQDKMSLFLHLERLHLQLPVSVLLFHCGFKCTPRVRSVADLLWNPTQRRELQKCHSGVSVAGPLCNDCIYRVWLSSAPSAIAIIIRWRWTTPELLGSCGLISIQRVVFVCEVLQIQYYQHWGAPHWGILKWFSLRASLGNFCGKKKHNKKIKIKSVGMRSALSGFKQDQDIPVRWKNNGILSGGEIWECC